VIEGRKDGTSLREKWRPSGGCVRLREGRKFSTGGGAAAGRRRLSFLGLGFFCIFFYVVKIAPLCLAENEGYL